MPELFNYPAALITRKSRAVNPPLTFAQIPGTGDLKVLNFALAAEALESDFYVQLLQRLTTGGTNALGIVIPGLNIASTEPDVQYVTQFGRIEAQHRDFLNTTITPALSIIGTGTNGILANAKFDFALQTLDRAACLSLLYTIENTGTQAYLGVIPSFATKTYLGVAAGIQATEARHTTVAAILRNYVAGSAIVETAPLTGETKTILGSANTAGIDGTLTPDQVLSAVSPFIVLPAATAV